MIPVETFPDLAYAEVDGHSLALDVYRPGGNEPAPVVIYLHGGGWQVGDKTDGVKERLEPMAARGVAVVSANYRFVAAATYPAQVHDVKGVVRWLRAHGADYGLATERIGIWGVSAGAYLASMVGLTPGQRALEGSTGGNPSHSSTVQAVVHWFGQSDLLVNARRSWLERQILNPPFEGPLLGVDSVENHADVARAASPLSWVTANAPPFLVAHGDQDRVTPPSESLALHDALVRAGARSTMVLVGGAGHEGPEFDRPDQLSMTAAFLRTHLEDPSAPGPARAGGAA